MEMDVIEARPAKRRREGQRDSDMEGDSDSFCQPHQRGKRIFSELPRRHNGGRKKTMGETRASAS
eukprot:5869046-Heterocapsa_arctica.AAC.1